MKFFDILENTKAHPGEYLYHVPSKRIVVCGAFKPSEGKIKVLANGRLFEDSIKNFQKIQFTHQERKEKVSRRCSGCKK